MEKIIKDINSLAKSKKMIIVAMDGMPGGGKSTLTKYIQKAIPNIKLVKMDDFFHQDQQNDDHRRVKRDVLDPLRKNQTARFIIYDWDKDKMVDAEPITPDGIILVEGIYSMEKTLVGEYDYKIWIDCPPEVGLERGTIRDKGYKDELWKNKWIPETVQYINKQKPHLKADIVINYKDVTV